MRTNSLKSKKLDTCSKEKISLILLISTSLRTDLKSGRYEVVFFLIAEERILLVHKLQPVSNGRFRKLQNLSSLLVLCRLLSDFFLILNSLETVSRS